MKKIFLILALTLAACGPGGSNGTSKNATVSNVDQLPSCDFNSADYYSLVGSYKNVNELAQKLAGWSVRYATDNNCKVDADILGQRLDEKLSIQTQQDGEIQINSRNGGN